MFNRLYRKPEDIIQDVGDIANKPIIAGIIKIEGEYAALMQIEIAVVQIGMNESVGIVILRKLADPCQYRVHSFEYQRLIGRHIFPQVQLILFVPLQPFVSGITYPVALGERMHAADIPPPFSKRDLVPVIYLQRLPGSFLLSSSQEIPVFPWDLLDIAMSIRQHGTAYIHPVIAQIVQPLQLAFHIFDGPAR